MSIDLELLLRDVPDFPKPGVAFKDIMPLIGDREGFRYAVDQLAEFAEPLEPDLIVSAESRGFIVGGALAYRLGCGFAAARKPGKLPGKTVRAEYELEYGVDALELHTDALFHGARVLVHDDLLATGGTARATVELVERLGGLIVGAAFIVELDFLHGRVGLDGYEVHSLVHVTNGT